MERKCGCWAVLKLSVKGPCKSSDPKKSANSIPRTNLVYDAGMDGTPTVILYEKDLDFRFTFREFIGLLTFLYPVSFFVSLLFFYILSFCNFFIVIKNVTFTHICSCYVSYFLPHFDISESHASIICKTYSLSCVCTRYPAFYLSI